MASPGCKSPRWNPFRSPSYGMLAWSDCAGPSSNAAREPLHAGEDPMLRIEPDGPVRCLNRQNFVMSGAGGTRYCRQHPPGLGIATAPNLFANANLIDVARSFFRLDLGFTR